MRNFSSSGQLRRSEKEINDTDIRAGQEHSIAVTLSMGLGGSGGGGISFCPRSTQCPEIEHLVRKRLQKNSVASTGHRIRCHLAPIYLVVGYSSRAEKECLQLGGCTDPSSTAERSVCDQLQRRRVSTGMGQNIRKERNFDHQ